MSSPQYDPREMASILRRVSYKPAWEFLVSQVPRPHGPWQSAVVVSYTAPDSRGEGRPVTVTGRYLVPEWIGSAEAFWDWFRNVVIADTERHETDEFLRLDGRIVNDPHEKPRRAVNPFAPATPCHEETGKRKRT